MKNDETENGSWTRPTRENGLYKIPAENLPRLEGRLADLQKKAARLVKRGLTPEQVKIGLEVVETIKETPKATEENPFPAIRVFYMVRVTGSKPQIAGWEFVATLQHEGDAGTILRTVPTADLTEGELKAYREVGPDCEHCNVHRRRNETFVVRSESKELKQVGRQCIRDFLGHKSPEALADFAEFLSAAGEAAEGEESFGGGGGGGGGEYISDLTDYLAFVALIIREDGWLSRTAARDRNAQATADTAWTHRFPPRF